MSDATVSNSPVSGHGQRFAGRAAIVTGASRGIGLAVAQRIVAEGGSVCITARKPDGLAEAATQLAAPDRVVTVAGRADDADHRLEAVQTARERFGRLDVLVNNTGINPIYGRLTEVPDDAARKIMDVNVLAALGWARECLRDGLGDGSGAIVNIASIAGLAPAPGIAYYGVSKAALLGLTVQLAAECAAAGVRVNAVAPAVVKTRFAEALYSADEAKAAAGYPLGRLGEPEDVAAAVAFLAGADASWITGQVLVIDGGVTLRAAL